MYIYIYMVSILMSINTSRSRVLPNNGKRGVASSSKQSTPSKKFQRVGGSCAAHQYIYIYISMYGILLQGN